jgi:tetratricopeptide (TPR) repeat protein
MANNDWFRNTSWDGAIEAAFFKKLARARDKQQYLKIQAGHLASSHPAVALRLLEQYFSMGDNLFFADAWRTKAEVHIALGEVENAIAAFEAALAREASFGKVFTNAWLDYASFIAAKGLGGLYDRALELVDGTPRGGLVFPAEAYRRNAVRAVILAERGSLEKAREAALLALTAASQTHSGITHHPTVGLVDANDPLRARVEEIAGPATKSWTSSLKGWLGRA